MKNIGIIRRISYLLPQTVLKNLYFALIYPYLTYCNLIWTSTYPVHLNKLKSLQKRAIRIITNSPYNAHTKYLFQRLKLLNLNQIRYVQIGEVMYKYNKNLLPIAFTSFFPTIKHLKVTRSNSTYSYPLVGTNVHKLSIKYQGPFLWNNLPHEIKTAAGLSQFRCLIKNHALYNNNL